MSFGAAFAVPCYLALMVLTFLGACSQAEQSLKDPEASVPNILLIVADDLGYTDLGAFGGEIPTPTLDRLASDGLVLTSYYTAPLCAPTRSELLSGTDHHLAGQGLMSTPVADTPGYEGRLNDRVITIADRLRAEGFHTFMTGKWHLGGGDGQRPASRGFDRSFILTDGGSTHYADGIGGLSGRPTAYYDNDKPVERLPEDFYSTDFYTDQMIEYIGDQAGDDKPFFAYLAYTAPHWPVQAPQEDVEAFSGWYDEGWEVLRERRFEGWVAAGMPGTELPDLPSTYPAWASQSAEEQARSIRIMETHAAMVARLDRQIGRLLEFLERSGELENTVIIFQSDNGAEANPGYPGIGGDSDNSLENIGKPGSFPFLGPGWAEAGSAPFRQNKTYTSEGGIRVPAFIVGPGVRQGRSDAVLMGYDIAPTLLALAGVAAEDITQPEGILPITGRSFAGLFGQEDFQGRRGPKDIVGREHSGHGAIRRGDWKLTWENDVSFYQGRAPREDEPPAGVGIPIDRSRISGGYPAGVPIGTGGPWKLFNIRKDPAERHDLADEHPELVAELLTAWDEFVKRNGVVVRSGELM